MTTHTEINVPTIGLPIVAASDGFVELEGVAVAALPVGEIPVKELPVGVVPAEDVPVEELLAPELVEFAGPKAVAFCASRATKTLNADIC